MKKISLLLLALAMVIGCSGGGDKPEGEQLENSGNENPASENSDSDSEAEGNSTNEGTNSAANGEDDASENSSPNEASSNNLLPSNSNVAPTLNNTPSTNNKQPLETTPSAARVVRYVTSNETIVYTHPAKNEPSPLVLQQGDVITVEITDQWAKIDDNHYVEVTSLSEQPVAPVLKSGDWKYQNK